MSRRDHDDESSPEPSSATTDSDMPSSLDAAAAASSRSDKYIDDEQLIIQALNADGSPRRPMNAFMIFARRRRPQVSAANQTMRTGEISKILSREWATMAMGEKEFYLDQAKRLKDIFNAKYPDYVYRRRPNNSRRKPKTSSSSSSTLCPVDGTQDDSSDTATTHGNAGYGDWPSPSDAHDDLSPVPPPALPPPLPSHHTHHPNHHPHPHHHSQSQQPSTRAYPPPGSDYYTPRLHDARHATTVDLLAAHTQHSHSPTGSSPAAAYSPYVYPAPIDPSSGGGPSHHGDVPWGTGSHNHHRGGGANGGTTTWPAPLPPASSSHYAQQQQQQQQHSLRAQRSLTALQTSSVPGGRHSNPSPAPHTAGGALSASGLPPPQRPWSTTTNTTTTTGTTGATSAAASPSSATGSSGAGYPLSGAGSGAGSGTSSGTGTGTLHPAHPHPHAHAHASAYFEQQQASPATAYAPPAHEPPPSSYYGGGGGGSAYGSVYPPHHQGFYGRGTSSADAPRALAPPHSYASTGTGGVGGHGAMLSKSATLWERNK